MLAVGLNNCFHRIKLCRTHFTYGSTGLFNANCQHIVKFWCCYAGVTYHVYNCSLHRFIRFNCLPITLLHETMLSSVIATMLWNCFLCIVLLERTTPKCTRTESYISLCSENLYACPCILCVFIFVNCIQTHSIRYLIKPFYCSYKVSTEYTNTDHHY